jgi:hypothetical protein
MLLLDEVFIFGPQNPVFGGKFIEGGNEISRLGEPLRGKNAA